MPFRLHDSAHGMCVCLLHEKANGGASTTFCARTHNHRDINFQALSLKIVNIGDSAFRHNDKRLTAQEDLSFISVHACSLVTGTAVANSGQPLPLRFVHVCVY